MSIFDLLFIIFISFLSTLFGECISWLLVYRTEEYIKLIQNIQALKERAHKKNEPLIINNQHSFSSFMMNNPSSAETEKKKKSNSLQEQVDTKLSELNVLKLKSTIVLGIILFIVFTWLSNYYDGVVVAKLPFQPIPVVQSLSHRGLFGTDSTDCSFVFIYALCSIGLRANVVKLLGFQDGI